MRPNRTEPHSLVGPYVLDAVTPEDRARFERHLSTCSACATEVDELRRVTAGLAAAVASPVPDGLIAQVVRSAAATPQLTATAARFAWATKTAAVLAVVLMAVTAGAGFFAVRADHQLTVTQFREHQIAEVLNAPDAIMKTVRARSAGTVTVVVSRRERALVFTTEGLPRLPAGHCYQLWLVGPAGERSANMLPPSRNGMTSPVVAAGLTQGDWASLTVEPAGGSEQPTTAPILMLSLAG
ncbi:MAG TPA: anti-sigma factor [Streptosporangiaceae bacterium]|jgi:anti-sigma-K factor RskA|nr:anti-sigma factor [Streptosporangiaceae bacterium]